VLRGGKHGKHGVPVAAGAAAPSSAQDALVVFPHHLESFATGVNPGGWVHLQGSTLWLLAAVEPGRLLHWHPSASQAGQSELCVELATREPA
jgi:hypothetical protein